MRRSMIVGILLILMLGLAAPAWAQQGGQASEAFVVLSGRADVPKGQRSVTWSSSTAPPTWTAPWTAR